VDPGLVIEEAARLLSAENKDVANVVNSKGRHLGTISMGDIIGAIVPANPQAAPDAAVAEAR
jgi:glycine betaine/proline transport system ATP-binding protein